MRVEEELRTYLLVLWRYKWMIAVCAIIASMVALGISLQLTPVYSATATLRVASAPLGAGDYLSIYSLTRLSNTYVEIATSDISLNEVARRLGLQKQPSVQVEVVPETELITISASDPDPARARDIANTLASIMVEQSVQLYGGGAPTAREILENQLEQARADLDAAISEYQSALRAATLPASGTPIPGSHLETLAQIVGVRRDIYYDLLQNYEDAWTRDQLRANAITVSEPAYLPLSPATPRVPLSVALGLLAGLTTGVILAFVFEGMDDTLRGIEDVQAMTTLPILGQIPEGKRTLASLVDPTSPRAGRLLPMRAFHQLSARLLLSEATPKSTSFLITSPEPGAGKSTVAANLAMSLGGAGHRVVLVDMDLHRPRQHSIFNLPNGKGLSDFMCGKIQLDAALQHTQFPSLRVVTAGSSLDETSAEWLAPVKIEALVERLGHDGDYVLIDAPALLSVADPAVIASQADAVILVVARRGTERKHLRLALQQLAELNARIAGIVVNKVSMSRLYTYYGERSPRKAKPIPSEEAQPPEERERVPVSMDELGLPASVSVALKGAGMGSAEDLLKKDDEELLAIRGLGAKSLEKVRASLKAKGLIKE
jgi:succinoglycan biosynthesis transport protein ExoP